MTVSKPIQRMTRQNSQESTASTGLHLTANPRAISLPTLSAPMEENASVLSGEPSNMLDANVQGVTWGISVSSSGANRVLLR